MTAVPARRHIPAIAPSTARKPISLLAPRRRIVALVVGLLAGVALPCGVAAQVVGRPRYVAREVPLPEGASTVVTDLAVDSLGYLYIGTGGGLLRFDGRRVVRQSVVDLPQLESNRVNAVAAAAQGVWLGTPEGRLLHLVQGRVRDSLRPLAADDDGVWAIAVMPDGTPVIRTQTRVVRYRDGAWQTLPWGAPTNVPYESTALLVTPRGTLYAGSTRGLQELVGDSLRGVPTPARSRDGLEPLVRTLARGVDGEVWIATTTGLIVELADGTMLPVEHPPEARGLAEAVAVDDEGVVWIGGAFGLVATQPRRTARAVVLEALQNFSLKQADGTVRFVLSDGRGSIIASTGSGTSVLVITRSPVRVLGTQDGLPQPFVHNLEGDGAGGLWVATTCRGVTHFTADGLRRHDVGELGILDGWCIRSLLRDSLGTLWIARTNKVSRVEPDGRARTIVIHPNDRVNAGPMLEDGAGGILVGLRPGGVRRVTPEGAVTEPPELARLAQASVWSLVHDARGSLWIGQVGALTRVDAGGVRTFGLADGVPPGPVRVLLPDPDGTLWLATYGGGLARFRNGRFERLTMRDGLFDDALSALLPDQRGRLWLLGNRGVSIVRRTRLDSVFTRRAAGVDGLTLGGEVGVPEGNGGFPAAWSDGRRFFFASVDGVTVVDPEELERRRISPQPVIEALVTPDGERPLDDVVGVAAGVRGTALRVSAPALDGRTVRLRYRVEGRREGWIEVGPERLVPLDGLPPGRHPIELATRDEWGGWSSAPAELVVEVQGRWWQLVWVRVLAVGLLLGIVVAALRGRALAAEARARALRHEIARRERAEAEAQARLHDLAHISRVAVAGELATSLAHELNQPLAAIVSNADAARRMLAAPVGAPGSGENVDDVLRDISSEGKRASGVIRTLREFLRRGAGEHQAVDLAEVIAEVLPVLRHLLERERVTVVVHGTVGLPRVMGDRIALQQVLMNLIMNAVEAMRDTPPELRLIEVRGHVVDGEVVLSVRDSGPGVEPARREQVFRPFETTKPGGMGMGLAISRSIAESHDGDLEVLDAEGGGAEFRLRLPAAPR